MKSLYVVGGQQKKEQANVTKEWHLYQKGIILRVDLELGSSEICVEYVTPSDACAAEDDPSIQFKAGTLLGNTLYVCTQTEILMYQLDPFECTGYISLPCFNDLHHVSPTLRGTLLVANTGLDMVVEITLEGNILREWHVLGEEPWDRFSREVDYRKVVTTKPHQSHPNYVIQHDGDIWVTRFEQKDVLCLTKPEQRLDIGIERPHDGIAHGESVYFTTVNGYIIAVNLKKQEVERVVDLNNITKAGTYHPTRPLGWCRGLTVLDDDHVIVGFTKLRRTKWRENVRWAKRQLGIPSGSLPTRIALYDLGTPKLCWEKNLQESGMDAVFSIHATEVEPGH